MRFIFCCSFGEYLARNNGVFDKGYYKLYQIFAKNILSQKIIRCSDPKVGVTLHSIEDDTKLAIIINYGNGISAPIWLKDDIKVEKVITGRLENGVAYFEADCAAFIIRTINSRNRDIYRNRDCEHNDC